MARSTPAVTAVDPAKLAAWRARRQHIEPPAAKGQLEQVATDLVGIQAQVPSSAALSLAVRIRDGRVSDPPKAVAERRLVRAWGQRGTLHLWAADDFPLIVAALGQRETWRRPVWFRYFGVTEAEMEALIEAVGDILGDGRPRSRGELAAEIGDRLGPKQAENLGGSWGTYLKPAATPPTQMPAKVRMRPLPMTSASTLRGGAPIASRIPISRLLYETKRDITPYKPTTARHTALTANTAMSNAR